MVIFFLGISYKYSAYDLQLITLSCFFYLYRENMIMGVQKYIVVHVYIDVEQKLNVDMWHEKLM